MKKKSKIILGGCIVVAALIGLSVWNTWFSATKIAFVNFQTIQQGSISKANDNSFIKLSEVSLDNLDRLTSYDMVFINGMGLRIVEEQRQQIQQAADKGHIKPDIFYKAKSEENGRNSTVGYHHPLYPHGEHKGLYGLFLNRP